MNYENLRVEVYKLQIGVDKLLKYGMDTFEIYADEINMSFCDRNRVISKCIIAYGKKELNELPCPKNLIGERWEYYTKTMRHTPEKARELLKRIDISYNAPFIPSDVSRLVGGIG
jgi:hypothetical protein